MTLHACETYVAVAGHDEEVDAPAVRLVALRPAAQLPAVGIHATAVRGHAPQPATSRMDGSAHCKGGQTSSNCDMLARHGADISVR